MEKTDKELILAVLQQMGGNYQYSIDTMLEELGVTSMTRINDLLEKMVENKLVAPTNHHRLTVMSTQKGITLNSYSYDKLFPPRQELALEILEHLYKTYFKGEFVNITELVLDHSPNITGTELKNILSTLIQSNYIQDNSDLYRKLSNPNSLNKMLSSQTIPFVNAKMIKAGYDYLNAKENMTEKATTIINGLNIKMGDKGIASFGANSINTINNHSEKENLIEVLSEIKTILATSKQQDKEIVELALSSVKENNTLDFGQIGKVLELCSNGATVLEFGQKILEAGIKLALATGVFTV